MTKAELLHAIESVEPGTDIWVELPKKSSLGSCYLAIYRLKSGSICANTYCCQWDYERARFKGDNNFREANINISEISESHITAFSFILSQRVDTKIDLSSLNLVP